MKSHLTSSKGRRLTSVENNAAVFRHAFTLFEVILAVALSTVLIFSLYAALDINYKLGEAGKEDAKRQQIARSVMNMIAKDIRCVTFTIDSEDDAATTEGGEIGGGEDPEVTDDTTTETETVEETEIVLGDPENSYFSESVGVFGNETTLVMHISKPLKKKNITYVDEETTLTSSGDLLSVSYYLAGTGEGALQQVVAAKSDSARGLVRMEGDRASIAYADESGDLDLLAEQAKMLAPEIVAIEFRYHDGIDWVEAWDSAEYGYLPSAIEIVIELEEPEYNANSILSTSASELTHTYRLVVPLAYGGAGLE